MEGLGIRRQQENNRIGGRLLDRLQESILRLLIHLLRLIDDIDLVIAVVGPDDDVAVDLAANVIHGDGSRLLMGQVDNIRLIVTHGLPTVMAVSAGIRPLLLAEQGLSEGLRQHPLPGSLLFADDIGMRDLLILQGIL
mgnify:CR=1 FL=1